VAIVLSSAAAHDVVFRFSLFKNSVAFFTLFPLSLIVMTPFFPSTRIVVYRYSFFYAHVETTFLFSGSLSFPASSLSFILDLPVRVSFFPNLHPGVQSLPFLPFLVPLLYVSSSFPDEPSSPSIFQRSLRLTRLYYFFLSL